MGRLCRVKELRKEAVQQQKARLVITPYTKLAVGGCLQVLHPAAPVLKSDAATMKEDDHKTWAKEMVDINKGNSPHNLRVLRRIFYDRRRDYGTVVFWGPFTEQELDDHGIAYGVPKATEELWLTSLPAAVQSASLAAVLRDCARFYKDRQRELREQGALLDSDRRGRKRADSKKKPNSPLE
jgi:hypothetical protein